MNQTKIKTNRFFRSIATLALSLVISLQSFSQEISVWQFRHVDQSNMQEFIERETKYWSKVAEAGVAKGNLNFWGLFVKQGGFNLPEAPNVLFINTFNDIDAVNMGELWDASAHFPNTPMEDMETQSMSTTIHMIFAQPGNWVEKEGASPDDDYNFVRFVFHNSSSPGELLALENEHWAPFIKAAIEAGHTTQLAWGNARILAPSQPNMEANTISYDVHPTMKSALLGGFSPDADVQFPDEGLSKIMELEISRRFNNVYRRIMVINADDPN